MPRIAYSECKSRQSYYTEPIKTASQGEVEMIVGISFQKSYPLRGANHIGKHTHSLDYRGSPCSLQPATSPLVFHLPSTIDTMDVTPSGKIAQAINLLIHCTNEEIDHHGEQVARLLDRIGPRHGWSKGSKAHSRMLTAETFLLKMEQSVGSIQYLWCWSMVETVIDAMQKKIPPNTENASLAFGSLDNTSSHIERLLHVQFALYHAYACYGSYDDVSRPSNPEKFYQGKIPTYCKTVQAETSVMRRGISRGTKTDHLRTCTGGPGISILVAPMVASLDLVAWSELQRVPTLIEHYPSILTACHDLHAQAIDIGAMYK